MKAHLKKAKEGFEKLKDKEYLINPMSEVDVDIVFELVEIFKKLGRSDLQSIMNNWKYNKDTDIRDALIQWNIDFNNEVNDLEDSESPIPKLPIPYITMQDYNYCLYDIRDYGISDGWNYDKNKPFYMILLNRCDDSETYRPKYMNHKVIYEYIDDRDRDFELLDAFFKDDLNVNFIN